MKNKIKLVVSLCLILAAMTACGTTVSKKAGLTCTELQAKLVEMNLTDKDSVTNITNEDGQEAFGCLTKTFCVVAFVDFGNDTAGCDEEMKLWIEDLKPVADKPEKNLQVYEQDSQDAYLVFSRVGNTLMMVSGVKKDKAEMLNTLQTLGYY